MIEGKFFRWFLFCTITLSFIIGGMGCGQKKEKSTADNPLPANGYKAEINLKNPPTSMKLSSSSEIKATVKNISEAPWPALGQSSVRLSYHWLNSEG